MLAWILANRTLAEIAVFLLMLGGGYAWWVHHDHVEQAIGEQTCEQKLTVTKEQATLETDNAIKAAQKSVDAVVAKYEAQTIDPVVPSIAGRLYYYTLRACPVPDVPAAAGAVRPAQEPADTQAVERALTAHLAACADDANEVNALREAWSQLAKSPTQ